MKFRKKPVVIDAIQWTGTNYDAVQDFCGANIAYSFPAVEMKLAIQTLEGTLTASCFDWIIRGVKGEYYACKPDIFEATYEKVDS